MRRTFTARRATTTGRATMTSRATTARRTTTIRRAATAAGAAALAFVTAIALVPAAHAWQEPAAPGLGGSAQDLTDIVRIAPDAQQKQTAPQLTPGVTGQGVPDLQIKLPIKTEPAPGKQYATWQPGDAFTVTLPPGITFTSAPAVASSDLVDLSDAAFGTAATATVEVDGGSPVTLQAPQPGMTLSPDKTTATILIPNSQWAGVSAAAQNAEWLNVTKADFGAATQPGFYVTLSGIRLNVAAGAVGVVTATVAGESTNGFYGRPEYATFPAQAPTACTVGAVGGTRMTSYLGGTTTLGYLPPLRVSAAQPSGQVLMASTDLQQIPAITVSGAVAAGAGYKVAGVVQQAGKNLGAVLFDFPTHQPRIDYMDAKVTTSGAVQGVSLVPSAGQYGVTRTAQLTMTASAGGNGTVSISGLRVAGYVPTGQVGALPLPAGSLVSVVVAAPAGTNAAVNNTSTVGCLTKPGASTFSDVVPVASAGEASAQASLTVAKSASRIGGLNRYGTAAELAAAYAALPGTGPVSAVVVANGENRKGGFDALSANFLAGQVGAPVLLTAAGSLPGETALALRGLLNGSANPTIYVMGKADSVSDAVVTRMTAIAREAATGTVTVQRVAGANRFATSTLAASVGTVGSVAFASMSPKYKTAIVASGTVNADALAAGPLSFSLGLPVLLTGAGALPGEVSAYIKAQKIEQVFVLGGMDRVPAAQLAQLRSLGVKVAKRIAGANRFATSADLYSFALAPATTSSADGGGLGWGSGRAAYLANGVSGFPDALAVGPLAGAQKSVLVTSGPTRLDPSVAALTGKATTVVGLGQPATVPDSFVK